MTEDSSKTDQDVSFKPPRKSFGLEMIVGIFGLLGLLAFGYLAINIGGLKLLQGNQYQVLAEFDNISGLTVGAPVEIAGVPIGEVSSIELSDTTAVVVMDIDIDHQLRDDDIASIRTKGIIGDKYLRISPGSSDEKIENRGHIFDTESVVDMEDIIGKVIHSLDS